MKSIFKLKEHNTSIKTEIVAGITSFMTMAYIITLNPNILTNYGQEGGTGLWNAIFLATCISSFIAMVCMAFLANKPYCLAPGMGLNSFFYTVVISLVAAKGFGYVESFQTMLCIILIEGVIFLILSLFNVREKIVNAIPKAVRVGIAPAIGLMLINIGFGSNIYIADAEYNVFYIMRDFFGSLSASIAQDKMGTCYPLMVITVITVFIGLFSMILLNKKKVKGSVVIGMGIASAFYWAAEAIFLKVNPFASLATANWLPAFADLSANTLFKFNFAGLAKIGWFTVTTLIISYCMIDMFDTIGTLVGTATKANMIDKDGNIENIKECLISDAVGTIVGAATGTPTVTTFIESASGIESGGRTGLTSLVCGFCFLFCIFLAPIAAIIPAAATSAALIYVGILMVTMLKNLSFDDVDEYVPAILMLIAMPISGSIGHGIGIGIIASTVIKLFSGKGKEVSIFTYILSILFLLKFFVVA